MQKRLLEIVRCPDCKGHLVADGTWNGDDLVDGALTCQECGFAYPVEASIPNLLPQEFHRDEVTE